MKQNNNKSSLPLIVDLDGTLIKTDLLFEGILVLIKRNFLFVFLIPIWLIIGKYRLKDEISRRVVIKPELLPYNSELIDFLKEEKVKGRKIILATASLRILAFEISQYLNLFSEIYCSENGVNLKSKNKRDLLVYLYGEKLFDYAGNSNSDFVIFKSCNLPVVVNASRSVIAKTKKINPEAKIFKSNDGINQTIRSIRVYQWVKNILVLVPLMTSLNWNNPYKVRISIITIMCFCFVASAGYLLNDLLDLESDRKHPQKKNRPIASGNLSIVHAVFTMFLLAVLGFGTSLFINISTLTVLLIYFSISTSYSFILKRFPLIDLFVLAFLYTLRIIAGSIAINVVLSFWLLGFSVFIFFSLAAMKRCAEIIIKEKTVDFSLVAGRGYVQEDLPFLWQIGISSGYMGIIVFALYINSQDVTILYNSPRMLWFACLLLMFWISHLWFSTYRNEMTNDPIIFSFRNKTSLVTLILIVIVILIAI